MKPQSTPLAGFRGPARWKLSALPLLVLGVGACASGPAQIPEPRPIIIRSGARLQTDQERMQQVDSWFRPQMENIEQDPSFLIEVVPRETPAYPWESLLIIDPDTARIGVDRATAPEVSTVYMIYAHYHLMDHMGRLAEFLPDGEGARGFDLERAILSRVSDAWLYGRSVFDAPAYDPLEELVYSKEGGYLDAFILTARGDDFSRERRAWLGENPQALEEYRQWFVDTFNREPPGLREGT